MLQLAQELCTRTIGAGALDTTAPSNPNFFTYGPLGWTDPALIKKNGDAALWFKLCSLNNRPIIRVISGGPWSDNTTPSQLSIDIRSLYWGDGKEADGQPVYPTTAPVLNHQGQLVNGITADNYFPACLRQPPGDPGQSGSPAYYAEQFRNRYLVGGQTALPYCPPALFEAADPAAPSVATDPTTGLPLPKWNLPTEIGGDGAPVSATVANWGARGAINAGLAVFLYVDQLSKGATPKVPYNHCEEAGP